MLDRGVFQNLARHAPITAADDTDAPGRPMCQDRHMGEHFMIDEIVALGRLDHVIQRQDAPKGSVLENPQALMIRFAVVKKRVDSKGLGVMRVQLLAHPGLFGHAATPASDTTPSPRSNSLTRTSAVPKARLRTSTAFHGTASPHMNTSKAP